MVSHTLLVSVMTLRLKFRRSSNVSASWKPVLEVTMKLEQHKILPRSVTLPDNLPICAFLYLIVRFIAYFLPCSSVPHYHVVSSGIEGKPTFVQKVMVPVRKFLIEEVYRPLGMLVPRYMAIPMN